MGERLWIEVQHLQTTYYNHIPLVYCKVATLTHHLQMYGADEGRVCGYLTLVTTLVTPLYEANLQPPVVGLLKVEGKPGRKERVCVYVCERMIKGGRRKEGGRERKNFVFSAKTTPGSTFYT